MEEKFLQNDTIKESANNNNKTQQKNLKHRNILQKHIAAPIEGVIKDLI